MTCCFQGWYHGNTEEEDGRLDSASLRRKCGREQRPSRCGGKVGAADITSLLITEKRQRAGESSGVILASGVVGVHKVQKGKH